MRTVRAVGQPAQLASQIPCHPPVHCRPVHSQPGGYPGNLSAIQDRADRVQALLDNRQDDQCQSRPEIAAMLGVHTSTIKAWRRAGLLTTHKANDKNIPLFDPPTPGDPRLVKRQGSKLTKRVHTAKTPGGAV